MIEMSEAPVQTKERKKKEKVKKRKISGALDDSNEKIDDASTDSDSEARSYGRRDSQSSANSGQCQRGIKRGQGYPGITPMAPLQVYYSWTRDVFGTGT